MINLTSNTILHCNCNTGSDSTGDGSSAHPFQTPAGAMNYLKGVNLNGFYVTIQLDIPGTYNCSFTVTGLFMGQTGQPYQLTIQGDTTGDFNVANTYVLSGVPNGGGCITATFRASFNLVGLKIDMYSSQQGESGVNGGGMALNIGTQAIVCCTNTVWGYQSAPFAYINVAAGAMLIMAGYVWCNPQDDAVIASFLGVGQSAYASCYLTVWLQSKVPTFTAGYVNCDEQGDVTFPDCAFIQYETYFATTFTQLSANTIQIPEEVCAWITNGSTVLGQGFPTTGLTIISGAGTTALTLNGTPTQSSGNITIGYPCSAHGCGFCISLGSLINTGTVTTIDTDNMGDIMYFPGDKFTTTLTAAANAGDFTIEVASVGTYPGAGIHGANPPVPFGWMMTQYIQGVGIAANTRVSEVSGNVVTLTKPLLQNMSIGAAVNAHGASTDGSYYR